MKKLLLLITLLVLSTNIHAGENQSIMFDNPTPDYVKNTKDSQSEQQAKHCKELSQKIDTLKGKPQRRYTATERYKQECQ